MQPSDLTAFHFGENDRLALAEICERIVSGKSLIEIAEDISVRYFDLKSWIDSHPDLKEQYNRALRERDHYLQELVISQLRQIASIDIRDIFKANGALKSHEEWPQGLGFLISAIEVLEVFDKDVPDLLTGHIKKIKFWNKNHATDKLGLYLSMFNRTKDTREEKTLEDLLRDAANKKAKSDIKAESKVQA